VSRGLGATQRRAVEILEAQPSGLTVAELAARLGVPERRARKVADSLVERKLVVIVKESGAPQRVWHVDRHGYHRLTMLGIARAKLRREQQTKEMLIRIRRLESICPCCGQMLPE
jgi:predicted ArsR family transcriptional regulator